MVTLDAVSFMLSASLHFLLAVVMLNVCMTGLYAECFYAECLFYTVMLSAVFFNSYANCHNAVCGVFNCYADCSYADCRIKKNVILSVVMPSVYFLALC